MVAIRPIFSNPVGYPAQISASPYHRFFRDTPPFPKASPPKVDVVRVRTVPCMRMVPTNADALGKPSSSYRLSGNLMPENDTCLKGALDSRTDSVQGSCFAES